MKAEVCRIKGDETMIPWSWEWGIQEKNNLLTNTKTRKGAWYLP